MHARARMNLGLQLALAGMLLRALLPAGWMPASHFASGTWLEICDGIAHSRLQSGIGDTATTSSVKHHRMPGHSRHEVCPFAAAAHLATGGDLLHPTLFFRLGWQLNEEMVRHAARAGPRLDAGSPRGPPSLI